MKKSCRVTYIQPCIGRKCGQKYLRSWQMDPLWVTVLSSLCSSDIDQKFYDDRIEQIPYDESTDLVAISVETYTAKRSYQIASEYRQRGIPVVMGGIHPTLCPEDASKYAESIVIGEAEALWQQVIDDYLSKSPKKVYKNDARPILSNIVPNRDIFHGKRYLPLKLIDYGRGCLFDCDFCSIQSFFNRSYSNHPIEKVTREIQDLKKHSKMFFLVNDNLYANRSATLAFLKTLATLKIRWISQATINIGDDDELLYWMNRSGCQGVLIGFESLEARNLAQMGKTVNSTRRNFQKEIESIYKYNIVIYGTFVFGYDYDSLQTFNDSLELAISNGFYLSAFAHLMPMPGTQLYNNLRNENRLLYDKWWLDDNYRFGQIAFNPKCMTPEELHSNCLQAKRKFFSPRNIMRRAVHSINRRSFLMFTQFLPINYLHHREIGIRDGFPLGDQSWSGQYVEAIN